jgi:hypothetical protein
VRAVSLIINNAVRDRGSEDDFIGQLNAVEFLVITQPAMLLAIEERIQTRLEQAVDYFYPLKDRDEIHRQPKHLSVALKKLVSSDGPFKDLEALKQSLKA